MMIHLFFSLVILVSALSIKHRAFFYLALLMLFLFAALRYGYGNDYFSYSRCFLEIHAMGSSPFPGEWLFTVLNRILPHYFWLIACTSLAFIYAIGRFLQKNVPDQYLWFSFFLLLINPYLFLMHLSAIRQCMALVCFLFAVSFAHKRRPLSYVLLCASACGFHNSAVVLFPIYFWANERQVSRRTILALAAGTAVLLCSGHWLEHLVSKSLTVLQLTRYQHVITTGTHNSLRATLLSAVPLIYLLWLLPRLQGRTLVYAKLWFAGCLLSVLAFRLSMLTRPEMYFDFFSIAAFPRLLKERHGDHALSQFFLRWLFPAVILMILVLRYYSFFTNPMWKRFFAYRTIL